MIKIGFLDFVEGMRSKGELRLFPEILPTKQGLSDRMSKWFGGFVELSLGNRAATFHSLRHSFRDGLRNSAQVTSEVAEALGGWGNHRRSQEAGYGNGFELPLLKRKLDCLEYSGLDLSHLYVNTGRNGD